jgi:hypothetical protein
VRYRLPGARDHRDRELEVGVFGASQTLPVRGSLEVVQLGVAAAPRH